jgi:predicted metalloendopeptidase
MSDLLLSFNVLQISPDGLGLPDRNYYYREPDHAVIISFDFEQSCTRIRFFSVRGETAKAKGGRFFRVWGDV